MVFEKNAKPIDVKSHLMNIENQEVQRKARSETVSESKSEINDHNLDSRMYRVCQKIPANFEVI